MRLFRYLRLLWIPSIALVDSFYSTVVRWFKGGSFFIFRGVYRLFSCLYIYLQGHAQAHDRDFSCSVVPFNKMRNILVGDCRH